MNIIIIYYIIPYYENNKQYYSIKYRYHLQIKFLHFYNFKSTCWFLSFSQKIKKGHIPEARQLLGFYTLVSCTITYYTTAVFSTGNNQSEMMPFLIIKTELFINNIPVKLIAFISAFIWPLFYLIINTCHFSGRIFYYLKIRSLFLWKRPDK